MSKLIKMYSDDFCKKVNNNGNSRLIQVLEGLNRVVDEISNYKKTCNENNEITRLVDSFNKIFEKIDGCKMNNENTSEISNLVKIIDKLSQTINRISCCDKITKELEKLNKQLKEKLEEQLKQLEKKCREELEEQLQDLKNIQEKELKKLKKEKDQQLLELEEKCKEELKFQLKQLEKKYKEQVKEIQEKQDEKDINLEKILNRFNCDKWIIGEYKWMPVDSKMPKGWVRVSLADGFTLVQGSKSGLTKGNILFHNHGFINNNSVWTLPTKEMYYVNRPGVSGGADYTPVVKVVSGALMTETTAFSGSENNLAAGSFAELWQYQGILKCI